MQVTAQVTAATQHLTTIKPFGYGDIIACTFMMFGVWVVIVLLCGVWADCHYTPFARRVERWVEREFEACEKIGLWFANRYWFIRCIFSKSWWRNRNYYKKKSSFGMSWEGKERDYMNRYAGSKT